MVRILSVHELIHCSNSPKVPHYQFMTSAATSSSHEPVKICRLGFSYDRMAMNRNLSGFLVVLCDPKQIPMFCYLNGLSIGNRSHQIQRQTPLSIPPALAQGGYSEINVTGGGGGGGSEGAQYFEPKKIPGSYIVHPKKYKTGNHTFGSCGNFGLNWVRTISLAEIRTQKIHADFSDPKKYTVKSSTQKNTGVENF